MSMMILEDKSMVTGFEAFALSATDLGYMSSEVNKIITPLAHVSTALGRDDAIVGPDEVRRAFDKVNVSLANMDKKLAECASVLQWLSDFDDNCGETIDPAFPGSIRERAAVLTEVIGNLKAAFEIMDASPSWKPYAELLKPYQVKTVRSASNVRNAYLSIARVADQFVSPVMPVNSSVTGCEVEFAKAVDASAKLAGHNLVDWS